MYMCMYVYIYRERVYCKALLHACHCCFSADEASTKGLTRGPFHWGYSLGRCFADFFSVIICPWACTLTQAMKYGEVTWICIRTPQNLCVPSIVSPSSGCPTCGKWEKTSSANLGERANPNGFSLWNGTKKWMPRRRSIQLIPMHLL
jgi:hypothetical protein